VFEVEDSNTADLLVKDLYQITAKTLENKIFSLVISGVSM